MTTVSPPARLRQTYTGPVGTSRRRTRRAAAWRRRRAAARAEDVVRVVEVRFFVVEVVVVGVVTAASLPPPLLPPLLPRKYSAVTIPTTTTSTAQPRPDPVRRRRRGSRAAPGGRIGCISTSDSRSWRSLYSSIRSFPSRPSASAYVRRKLLTYVGPGSRSHSSFSSARRYFARIFVSDSTSEMSMRWRMRASRRVAPMSAIGTGKATRAGPSPAPLQAVLRRRAAAGSPARSAWPRRGPRGPAGGRPP